ncbi:IS4 family transposase [Spirochaetia bacterium]|nr:IS4 family transposase [Spirochaetia bacterium]
MSSIVKHKVGQYTYLFESTSYRDKNGNPQNKRIAIGKIDRETGEPIYKPEYLERVWGTDKQPDISDAKLFTINDVKNSSIKEYGVTYLLENIAREIGLTKVMMETLPNTWKQVQSFAFFMLATGEPAVYCEDWLSKTESQSCGNMSSQRISELLLSIDASQRMGFYEKWGEYRSEQELFALDITSVSSYSEFINDVEWGYNRDKEKLPQINICMVVGENSKLPIFQTTYSGSLKDVSTLKTTLQQLTNLKLENISIVMDKGFCSKKNIDFMLSDEQAVKFLLSVPFSLNFAKGQIEREKSSIDTVDNTIVIGKDVIRGVTKVLNWDTKHKVYTHVLYNVELANQTRNRLFGHVAQLKCYAQENPDNKKYSGEFDKYLCIEKSEMGNKISIKQETIEKQLEHSGWLVIVSNYELSAKQAINLYRSKDVVEKGFYKLKNCLDLERLRVHSDNSMQNKVFIGFIALILTAYIHKVMDEFDLYRSMTMKSMLKILEKLRVQYINGKRILYPLTLEQKTIFLAFGIENFV